MTTQGLVTGLGVGYIDVRVNTGRHPSVRDIFNNSSLTGRYIRYSLSDCQGECPFNSPLLLNGLVHPNTWTI